MALSERVNADIGVQLQSGSGQTTSRDANVGDIKDTLTQASANAKYTGKLLNLNLGLKALSFSSKGNYYGLNASLDTVGIGLEYGIGMTAGKFYADLRQSVLNAGGDVQSLKDSVAELGLKFKKFGISYGTSDKTMSGTNSGKQIAYRMNEYGKSATAKLNVGRIGLSNTVYNGEVSGSENTVSYNGKKWDIEAYSKDTKYEAAAYSKNLSTNQTGLRIRAHLGN